MVDWISIILSSAFSLIGLPNIATYFQRQNPNKVVEIDFSFRGAFNEGVIENFDESQGLGFYIDQDLIIHSSPVLHISITSQSHKNWLQLAPFVDIKLLSKRSFSNNTISYRDTQDGRGGGGITRNLIAVFRHDNKDHFLAPYLGEDFSSYRFYDGSVTSRDVDKKVKFFTLEPGELEIFDLDISFEWGYIYEFQVGVSYIYRGQLVTKWSRGYKVGMPKNTEFWTVKNVITYGASEYGDYPEDYLTNGFVKTKDQTNYSSSISKSQLDDLYKVTQNFDRRNF